MNQMELKIQLFGAFRDLEPSGELTFSVALPLSVAELKLALSRAVADYPQTQVDFRALIASSAFATSSQILTEQDIISESEQLAILPPVCGG